MLKRMQLIYWFLFGTFPLALFVTTLTQIFYKMPSPLPPSQLSVVIGIYLVMAIMLLMIPVMFSPVIYRRIMRQEPEIGIMGAVFMDWLLRVVSGVLLGFLGFVLYQVTHAPLLYATFLIPSLLLLAFLYPTQKRMNDMRERGKKFL